MLGCAPHCTPRLAPPATLKAHSSTRTRAHPFTSHSCLAPEAARASIPDVQLTYIASDPFRLGTNLTSRLLVTSPDNLTALLAADGGDEWGTVPKMEVEQSLLINLAYWNNYGHLLGELGPVVHNTMCTYMGLCTHQQVAGGANEERFLFPGIFWGGGAAEGRGR